MDPKALLTANDLDESDGIFLAKSAERTVWDDMAQRDATHAVISSDPDGEWRKSSHQIAQIAQHVTSETILLDVGCGYGRIAKYLLPERSAAAYIGVDGSILMLRLFKERYASSLAEQRTPAVWINGNISDLAIKSGVVDLVVVSAVFLHNHKELVRRAMHEIERVLRPGGKLLVFSCFPRRATLMGVQGSLYQLLLNLLGDRFRNGPVRYYSKRQVEDMLRGFSSRELVPYDFEVVPKSIVVLSGRADELWRKNVASPLNRFLASAIPAKWRSAFCRHYDVVAVK